MRGSSAKVDASKPLAEQKTSIKNLHQVVDFYLENDSALAESLIDSQSAGSIELANICLALFRSSPSVLKELALRGNQGMPKKLVLRAPSIEEVW